MATPTAAADEAAPGVTPAVVDALYRALLGYSPDAEGLAYWLGSEDVDAIIAGLVGTDRFRERALRLSGAASRSFDVSAAGYRLDRGRGLVELVDPDPRVPVQAGLDAVPWDEVRGDLSQATVRVLGRFAGELATELARRDDALTVLTGIEALSGGASPEVDVLVLTSGLDLHGLLWAAPDMLRSVRDHLLVPVQLSAALPPDEQWAARADVRRVLHSLGFVEVKQVCRRRHGGGVVRLDVTHATPDAGVLHTVERYVGEEALVPASTWMVAGRRGTVGRG